MRSKYMPGKLTALALSLGLLLVTGITVFSAQDSQKPPLWVGIYTTAGKVGLKWLPTPGAVRYKVYRSITSGKGYELIATTTDVSYIDAGVRPSETFYYVLRAVSATGAESVNSEERYIAVPVTGIGLPVKPPEWVGALVEEKRIRLAWLPSPSANALAYNVYRSKLKDKGFQLIGSTQDTGLTDTDVTEGETYYYALTTLDKEFKETKFSEVREVKFVLPEEARPPARPGGGPAGGPEGGPGPEETWAPGTGPGPRGGEPAVHPPRIIAKPTRIIGYIIKGKDNRPLVSPTDVDLGPDGSIYVTDTGTATIQVFKLNGEHVRSIGGYGQRDGKFEKLLGVDVDDAGNVFAADAYTGRIQKFDPTGRLIMRKNMSEDGKAIARDLGLSQPVTVFGIVKLLVAKDGGIFAVDNYNDCVEVYTPNGRYVKTFGGKGVTDGKLQSPTFAALGTSGEIFVTDCLNGRVQVFDKDGRYLWKFGSYGNILGTFGRPKGIYVDEEGRIYVADSMSNVVQAFDKDGRFLYLLGDERGKQMDLGTPNGIVMDSKRRIYMVEKLVNRVQIRQVGE
jgi:DNA-binding beta-propeller fold protein YncE